MIYDIIKIIVAITIGGAALFLVLLIILAIQQNLKHVFVSRRTINVSKKAKKKILEKKSNEKKEAPAKLKVLLQPENKLHFENFVELLANIPFPDYPQNLVDKKGNEIPLSNEQIEEYEDEYDEALDEEDRMYDLYIYYLKSKNIHLTESELSKVVDLYNKMFGAMKTKEKKIEFDISKIVNNAFPKKLNAWYPKANKNQKSHITRIFRTKINPSNN